MRRQHKLEFIEVDGRKIEVKMLKNKDGKWMATTSLSLLFDHSVDMHKVIEATTKLQNKYNRKDGAK